MNKSILVAITLFINLSLWAEEKSPFPTDSIFQLDSDWVRHDGVKVKLSDLSKSPTIVSMVFLGCQYSCPITVQDMKEMDQKLLKKTKKSYRMILISIDPDRDTPEAMRKFMTERKLDTNRWTIISSTPDNIRELAAALGYSYKRDRAMEFAHSMLTWIFNKQGVRQFTRTARKETIDETVNAMFRILH